MIVDTDKRIVLTLDAGGTNFVFSAIQGGKQVVEPVNMKTEAHDLRKCLDMMIEGFQSLKDQLNETPAAISFAFPGPADYPNGIIGDLYNLPAFRGGVPLGPILEEAMGIPVFINNDGDLFVYGEAIGGFLPEVNQILKSSGSPRQHRVLFGITLGTGFGAGITRDGVLFTGDNALSGEIWLLRHKMEKNMNVEEGASIRAVRKWYADNCGLHHEQAPEPKIIGDIARGHVDGDEAAAKKAFSLLGEIVGDAVSNAVTLLDGLVVIGGGLAGSFDLFGPSMIKEMNGQYDRPDGTRMRRLVQQVYNLEDETEKAAFIKGNIKSVPVPGSDRVIVHDPEPKIGVGLSTLGTSRAVAVGAYAYALNTLDI